jgi:hypothetical protein
MDDKKIDVRKVPWGGKFFLKKNSFDILIL